MSKLTILIVIFLIYNSLSLAMEKKPYHHLPDGSFRNPEGSPERNSNFKWSFRIYNQEKKKIDMTVPVTQTEENQKMSQDYLPVSKGYISYDDTLPVYWGD